VLPVPRFEGEAVLRLNPYLSYRGQAREAMEFYQSVLGGELEISTFEGYEDMGIAPDERHLVMHAQLTTPDGLVLMGADTPSGMPYEAPKGISVSLSGDDGGRLDECWAKLAEGGTVTLPYETPPWGGKFGMLTDRFGIDWMVAADA
jgi:PhnB protein